MECEGTVLHQGTEMTGFEVKHTYPEIGDRIFLLSAKRIDHQDAQHRLLVTMEDITERKQVENDLMHLAAIITSSEDGILSMDLDGRVITWNAGAERLYGYTGDEMRGNRMDHLIPAERSEEEEALMQRVRKGERIDHFETVRIHKDGHEVEVSLTVSPMKADDGSIIGISKIARDVTQQKCTERALRDSEELFHLLADNMDQLAWIAKPGGGSMWFNKRMLDYFGMTPDEIRVRGRELHHPAYFEQVTQSLRASAEKGEPWESIFPLKGGDGKFRWFLSRATPLKDADGKVLQWFGTSTDITDRMQAEEALKDADRRKDEFLATLAHELRNPLAPLRSGVEILASLEGDPTLKETREIMERQIDQMVRLVDDLLDLGRITSGRLVLDKQPMDLRQALRTAVETVRPKLDAKGQYLDERIPDHCRSQ